MDVGYPREMCIGRLCLVFSQLGKALQGPISDASIDLLVIQEPSCPDPEGNTCEDTPRRRLCEHNMRLLHPVVACSSLQIVRAGCRGVGVLGSFVGRGELVNN